MSRFHFVVPVISSAVANRWLASKHGDTSVERTLGCCLDSLLAQSAGDEITVHLCCHDLPFTVCDPRIVVHRAPFATPDTISREDYAQLSHKQIDGALPLTRRRLGDKYFKVKMGVGAVLADDSATHIMIVDADDMVHRKLAEYVLDHASFDVCLVNKGYSKAADSIDVRTIDGFHKMCGTCNVINVVRDKDTFRAHGDVHAFDRSKHWLFAGHASMHSRIVAGGGKLYKIPFRAAIYVTNTGDNISKTRRAGSGVVRWSSIRADFGQ